MKAMNKHTNTVSKSWIRGSVLAVGLVVVAVAGTLLWRTPAAQARLADWKLLPQPEAYTELYFNNSQELPSVPTTQSISFSFHLHNVEGATVTYPYDVVAYGANGVATVVKNGSVTLGNGIYTDVPVTFVLPKADQTGRTEVLVILPIQNQTIDFWLGAAK